MFLAAGATNYLQTELDANISPDLQILVRPDKQLKKLNLKYWKPKI
jgi:hypothetical protein